MCRENDKANVAKMLKKIDQSEWKVYRVLCSIYATFLGDCYYFKHKKFKKYVLFKSWLDVANYTPNRLNQFVFSPCYGRVGAAV